MSPEDIVLIVVLVVLWVMIGKKYLADYQRRKAIGRRR